MVAAGSSFESGRDAYTESGQYDIDREARQAEFDRMRAARGESVRKNASRETAKNVSRLTIKNRIWRCDVTCQRSIQYHTREGSSPNVEYELVSGI